MDEIDYMGEQDYSTVAMIAGERPDIGMTCSSTPTGKRGIFYHMCKDPSFGYKEFYVPSTRNPGWCQEMEDQFRAELTDAQYEHEILAEFGTEEAGVFNKEKLDAAMRVDFYTYERLTESQKKSLTDGIMPSDYVYDIVRRPPPNPFRTVGINILCPRAAMHGKRSPLIAGNSLEPCAPNGKSRKDWKIRSEALSFF